MWCWCPGLKDDGYYKHDGSVYEKFKKQFKRDKECWYETGLVWKEGNLPFGKGI